MKLGVSPNERTHLIDRIAARVQQCHAQCGVERLMADPGELGEDMVLGGEVRVERARLELQLLGEIPDRGVVKPSAGKELQGRFQDASPGTIRHRRVRKGRLLVAQA
jgi:hypothetical protein